MQTLSQKLLKQKRVEGMALVIQWLPYQVQNPEFKPQYHQKKKS
jgi:hypothetical protein